MAEPAEVPWIRPRSARAARCASSILGTSSLLKNLRPARGGVIRPALERLTRVMRGRDGASGTLFSSGSRAGCVLSIRCAASGSLSTKR
jgi:hypothetical protein